MNPPANDEESCGIGLYVINLESSNMPMPLTMPFRHELVGFTVFRSRSFEHGRERFRLHLGYFESAQRAEEALTVIRKHYPAASISAAPATNLGSLDDTLNTEFRLLRSTYARVVTPASPTTVPAPVAAKVVASAVVWAVAPAVPPPQHYALQLEWSPAPIIAAKVPRLAILEVYHLYTVRMLREGSPQQGLRLGFFTSAEAARRVAEYVRPEFPGVAVVPVSHREYSRATELARQRALQGVVRGKAPGASAVSCESEGRVAPARAAAPVLPTTPPRARGLLFPVQTLRTREEPLSLPDTPNLKIDHWRNW
jgi:hypothetical protein